MGKRIFPNHQDFDRSEKNNRNVQTRSWEEIENREFGEIAASTRTPITIFFNRGAHREHQIKINN